MSKKPSREDQKDDLYWAFKDKKISLHQFRAQMRDLGYDDDSIDIYTDGDVCAGEED